MASPAVLAGEIDRYTICLDNLNRYIDQTEQEHESWAFSIFRPDGEVNSAADTCLDSSPSSSSSSSSSSTSASSISSLVSISTASTETEAHNYEVHLRPIHPLAIGIQGWVLDYRVDLAAKMQAIYLAVQLRDWTWDRLLTIITLLAWEDEVPVTWVQKMRYRTRCACRADEGDLVGGRCSGCRAAPYYDILNPNGRN